MAVITISRQVGSGGDEIAARVRDRLSYTYFDKRLMVEAAAEVGLCDHEVIDFSEDRYHVRSFLSRLLREGPRPIDHVTIRQRDPGGGETLTSQALDEEQCIQLIRHTILSAHDKGNIVIVGRGGQAILLDKPGVLHVRIIAPLENRIQAMKQEGKSGIAEIKTMLARSDRATAQYVRRFHGIEWDDPAHYHLILNTALMGIDAAVETIITAARQVDPAPAAS
ncbi:MAG: cytidylate kinase-like family protein [Anaerolineae bacterium]|nr:cytidylate kinase-like family protein [Anaerolineae bacterium]